MHVCPEFFENTVLTRRLEVIEHIAHQDDVKDREVFPRIHQVEDFKFDGFTMLVFDLPDSAFAREMLDEKRGWKSSVDLGLVKDAFFGSSNQSTGYVGGKDIDFPVLSPRLVPTFPLPKSSVNTPGRNIVKLSLLFLK